MPSAMLPSQWNAFRASGNRNTSRNRLPSTIETTSMIAHALNANAMYIAPSTATQVRGSVTEGLRAIPANAISASVMLIRNCDTLYAILYGDHRFRACPSATPTSTPIVSTLGRTRISAPAHTPSVRAKFTVSDPRFSGIEHRSAIIVRTTIAAAPRRSRVSQVRIWGTRIRTHPSPATLAARIRTLTRRGSFTGISPQLQAIELQEFELHELEFQHIPLH